MKAGRSSRGLMFAGVVTAVSLAMVGCGDTTSQEASEHSTEQATSTALVGEGSSVTDTSDIRKLMAISTHVFSGVVQAVADTKALGPIPETQFNVGVGVSLKGEVDDDVVVNQQGGTVNGVYYSFNDDVPLEIGHWYLFATRHSQAQGWYTVVPVYGDVKITEQQARDPSSKPLAAAGAALRENPQARTDLPPTTVTSPSLTFPIPTPGDDNPPPPSPPQPTP